ncbi:MAG: CHASE2 domain-containing protein, partial [Proteobacteria bacterium]|nr:CHASE2 domain-containing protein [Pseudomonadota bacterium]
MKPFFARVLIGVAISLVFISHAARLHELDLVSRLDNILYDIRLRLTMPGGVDDSVVILDIDEKSLEEIGRWP